MLFGPGTNGGKDPTKDEAAVASTGKPETVGRVGTPESQQTKEEGASLNSQRSSASEQSEEDSEDSEEDADDEFKVVSLTLNNPLEDYVPPEIPMEVLQQARRSSIAVRKPHDPSFDEARSAKLRMIEAEYRQGYRYGHRMGGGLTPSPSGGGAMPSPQGLGSSAIASSARGLGQSSDYTIRTTLNTEASQTHRGSSSSQQTHHSPRTSSTGSVARPSREVLPGTTSPPKDKRKSWTRKLSTLFGGGYQKDESEGGKRRSQITGVMPRQSTTTALGDVGMPVLGAL